MHGGHQGAKKSMKYLFPSFITPGKSSGVRAQTFDVELSLAKIAISCAVNRPRKQEHKMMTIFLNNINKING